MPDHASRSQKATKVAGALASLFMCLGGASAMANSPGSPGASPLDGEKSLSPAQFPPEQPVLNRGLTVNEAKALHGIFGKEIDLSGLTIQSFVTTAPNCSYAQDKKVLAECGETNWSIDYAKDLSRKFNVLMWQATRLVQAQEGSHWKFNGHGDGSWLVLDPRKTFDDYTATQQRQIIADYASRYLHSSEQTWEDGSRGQRGNAEANLVLRYTVENRFPDAAPARHTFEMETPHRDHPHCRPPGRTY